MDEDLVTLVDENDVVIGVADKVAAHRGEGKLHRAASVFLFRKSTESGEVELLLQQRSTKKIVGAEQWANTVCGNVWPEESYEECAKRRLSFELGINSVELFDVVTFRYQVQCNQEFSENEIDHIFAGWFDGKLLSNPEEVASYKWIAWKDISPTDERWAPWFKLFITDKKVHRALENYVKG